MRFWATVRSRREGVYGGLRSSRLPAIRIVRDVRLTSAGDAEGLGRDVFGDDATRCGVGAITDLHGGDERRVDARADVGADRRAVLGAAVVVRGDVARPDVRALAHVGVADVGEVWDLGALADRRVLDLHEGARLGARVQMGVGAQVGERADRAEVL